jgi:hypothetical protein
MHLPEVTEEDDANIEEEDVEFYLRKATKQWQKQQEKQVKRKRVLEIEESKCLGGGCLWCCDDDKTETIKYKGPDTRPTELPNNVGNQAVKDMRTGRFEEYSEKEVHDAMLILLQQWYDETTKNKEQKQEFHIDLLTAYYHQYDSWGDTSPREQLFKVLENLRKEQQATEKASKKKRKSHNESKNKTHQKKVKKIEKNGKLKKS